MQNYNKNELTPDQIKSGVNDLKCSNSTLVLSTKTKNGNAEVSYAPFIIVDGVYYIILSKIASHYDNIFEGNLFQGMILQDESSAVNTFFRKRIIFNFLFDTLCDDYEVINKFSSIHGELVETVLKLNFNIFKLTMIDGRVVLGPGQAYKFDNKEGITQQITEKQ